MLSIDREPRWSRANYNTLASYMSAVGRILRRILVGSNTLPNYQRAEF